MNQMYEVIIIGGGPTGVALGIELGMQNIKTLILEKYQEPLLSPRAQGLNERTMELFMRWGIAQKMHESSFFPIDYPMRSVWCTDLSGTTYATVDYTDQIKNNIAAQKPLRIPLYCTENILREKLHTFDSVTFIKNGAVKSIEIDNQQVLVKTEDEAFHAKFAVGCDGANSITRQCCDIEFKGLAPKRKVISILFQSKELDQKLTVDRGFLYYLLDYATLSATGPVNIREGIWYAQIGYTGEETDISIIPIDEILEAATGIQFSKKILNAHFWDMQIQLAETYDYNNRIFLVGDSAHAFAPTGGLGLNTGMGDAVNLAWKLSAVLKKELNENVLATYESERRAIAIHNLNAAEKNAADTAAIKSKFPPEENPEGFAKESARVAKQHLHSGGITLGYCYDPSQPPMPHSTYTPTCRAGYFLPNKVVNNKSIYEHLSPTKWTLIMCTDDNIAFSQKNQLQLLQLPSGTYQYPYLLIRPDWHIALTMETFSEQLLVEYFDYLNHEGAFKY